MPIDRIAIACMAVAFGFAVVSVACSREVHGSRVALATVTPPVAPLDGGGTPERATRMVPLTTVHPEKAAATGATPGVELAAPDAAADASGAAD